jgi:hypothetical protein
MSLILNYRKTRGIIERGTRALQPAATDVLSGTLYFVTDELKLERSNGATWDTFSGASGANTGDVTLAGTPNYITIAGQVITRSLIDLTSHVTGVLPVANGGTGASSLTAARIPYTTTGGVLTTTSSLTFGSGNVLTLGDGIGSPLMTFNGANFPGFLFANAGTNIGEVAYDIANNAIEFYVGGTSGSDEKMRITNSGRVGIGTGGAPATSALLELASTTGALLIPRMTTTQKNALTAVNGMLVYDSTLAKFQGYQAGAWTNLI